MQMLNINIVPVNQIKPEQPKDTKHRYHDTMNWSVFPQNSYVKVVISNVTVLGDRTFKEITKIKWGHRGRP